MTTITINKKKLKLGIEYFTKLWFTPLPELQGRIQIELGQQRVEFPVEVTFTTSEIAMFSEKTGGNLIILVPSYPSPLKAFRYDTIIYKIDWSGF